MALPKLSEFSGSYHTKVLDRGPGWVEYIHIDKADTNRAIIRREYYLGPLVEEQKKAPDWQKRKKDHPMRRAARVPLALYHKSKVEGWDDSDWKKWLNNPDNALWRKGCWEGRV